MAGNYQGSQAFAQGSPGGVGVNRNTGSLNYSKNVIQLNGVVSSIGLSIALTYSSGCPAMFGLPQNWTWSIPFILSAQNNKSLTCQGRTYLIDLAWASDKGHQSGLRYVNNPGLKLDHIIPDGTLPSGKTYSWQFRQTDGAIDYFDGSGKIVQHSDIFGNNIIYDYIDQESGPLHAIIDTITDSWGVKVSFSYEPGDGITIISPGNAKTFVACDQNGVYSVVDSMAYRTSFSYTTRHSQAVLTAITHPSGLTTQISYTDIAWLDQTKTERFASAVQSIKQISSSNVQLAHTAYQYGPTSGATYTGYVHSLQMNGTSDPLFGGNPEYTYDTLVSHLDGSGNILSAGRVVFNYLHCPVEDHNYMVSATNTLVEAHRISYVYNIPEKTNANYTNYNMPVTVKREIYDPSNTSKPWIATRQTTMQYDDYGCIVLSTENYWDQGSGQLKLRNSVERVFYTPPTKWGGEMLQTETFYDAVTTGARRITYTLTDDQKHVASTFLEYQTSSNAKFLPWKTRSFSYDSSGRLTSETCGWANGASVPAGSVASYTNKVKYSYDASAGTNTVSTTDPLGNTVLTVYSTWLPGGPVLRKSTPKEQTETFTYDNLSRAIMYSDPIGRKTTTEYTIRDGENSEVSVVSTTATGYVRKYVFDQLGRNTEIRDNGDTTISYTADPNRIISQNTFDEMSRVTSIVDELGLKSSFSFDTLSRPVKATDVLGNVKLFLYDDINSRHTLKLNGDTRHMVEMDRYGQITTSRTYADSGDKTVDYCISEDAFYDGFGQVIATSSYQEQLSDPKSRVLLRSKNYLRDAEYKIINEVHSAASTNDGKDVDTLERAYIRDIFGQQYSYLKTTTYADKRIFKHQGPIIIYDRCNRISSIQNQLGGQETQEYDPNGDLQTLNHEDGTSISYERDSLGRMTRMTHSIDSNTETYTYAMNGKIASIEAGNSPAAVIRYDYYLDGSAQSVTYPDGKCQTYTIDSIGRVVGSTDAHGTTQKSEYGVNGLLQSRSSSAGTAVTYSYGMINNTYGVLTGEKTTGVRSLQKNLVYDGWGRPTRVDIIDENSSNTVLHAEYTYDSRSRLQQVLLSSQEDPSSSDLNRRWIYFYDGLDQLVSTTTTAAKTGATSTQTFVYDGNCNILETTTDGKTRFMTYNAFDQRTDSLFLYDKRGRLISDTAMKYSYDSNDRVTNVQNSQGSSSGFVYHPNGALSACKNNDRSLSFYYDAGAVNAVNSNDVADKSEKSSYFLQPGSPIASHNSTTNEGRLILAGPSTVAVTLGDNDLASQSYTSYGSNANTPSPARDKSMGFRHEFTDSSSGLIYLRSRFYQPANMSFLTPDTLPKENRYAYCDGNPITGFDPSGHSLSTGEKVAIGVAVAVVVTVATVLTCGAALAALGVEATTASLAVGAVSGATGAIAGDGTTTDLIYGWGSYTAKQAGEDALSGAVGGLVGSGSGAVACEVAMRAGKALSWEVSTIVRLGAFSDSIVGGAAGGFASGATMDAMTGQPIFSRSTAFSIVGGAIGVMLGATLTSGVLAGFVDKTYLPLRMRFWELEEIQPANISEGYQQHLNNKLLIFEKQADADSILFNRHGFKVPDRDPLDADEIAKVQSLVQIEKGGAMYDTISAHGSRSQIAVTVKYKAAASGPRYSRPISAKLLAKYLCKYQGYGDTGRGDILVKSCYGGHGNGQDIANVCNRPAWAAKGIVYDDKTDEPFEIYFPRR